MKCEKVWAFINKYDSKENKGNTTIFRLTGQYLLLFKAAKKGHFGMQVDKNCN